MRISLLLQREPFGRILEETLSNFLESRLGQSFQIKWLPSASSARLSTRNQVWLCNKYVNAIFVPGVKREVLLPIFQEFSRSIVWWRRPLQKLYVTMALAPKACRILAGAALEISPPLSHPDNLLILGGNNHIRLHDYLRGEAFVIGKVGFDLQLMRNEIHIREKNPYLSSPKLLDKASDGNWYSEELIVGTPINRLGNRRYARKMVCRVEEPLYRLYQVTAKAKRMHEYTEELFREIREYLQDNRFLDREIKRSITQAAEAAISLIWLQAKTAGAEIITVQTHGDFQPANILAGENQAWLIDWEYTARRQAAYDKLVFALASRFTRGLKDRIREALEGEGKKFREIFQDHPYVDSSTDESRRSLISLFLLEELALKLREGSNPLFKTLHPGFRLFCKEMRASLQLLQGNEKAA